MNTASSNYANPRIDRVYVGYVPNGTTSKRGATRTERPTQTSVTIPTGLVLNDYIDRKILEADQYKRRAWMIRNGWRLL